jgi:hypothetical protein
MSSTGTTSTDHSTTAGPRSGPRLLVCAAEPGHDEVHVSLADGVFDAGHERVFWQEDPQHEVLRLPREMPVAVRALRSFPRPRTAIAPGGETALLEAIRAGRRRA